MLYYYVLTFKPDNKRANAQDILLSNKDMGMI